LPTIQSDPSDPDENRYSFLVYDLRTGKIVLVYHVYVATGAIPPSESDIYSKALESASSFTETSRDSLGALQYDGDVTTLKHSHKVNVQEKRLIEVDSGKTSAARQKSPIVPP